MVPAYSEAPCQLLEDGQTHLLSNPSVQTHVHSQPDCLDHRQAPHYGTSSNTRRFGRPVPSDLPLVVPDGTTSWTLPGRCQFCPIPLSTSIHQSMTDCMMIPLWIAPETSNLGQYINHIGVSALVGSLHCPSSLLDSHSSTFLTTV